MDLLNIYLQITAIIINQNLLFFLSNIVVTVILLHIIFNKHH